MAQFIDLKDQRVGRWTVIERAENNDRGQARWLCRCDCGTEKMVLGANLHRGLTMSCGCYRRESSAERTTHGHSRA